MGFLLMLAASGYFIFRENLIPAQGEISEYDPKPGDYLNRAPLNRLPVQQTANNLSSDAYTKSDCGDC